MFPLRTYVRYKHHTPFILGRTVINLNIDDNRCLQRCLILASEGGHKIIANGKVCDESVYNKWWKKPKKYKVFGETIHEVEEAMGIRDNVPFDASEEKFAVLEAVLKISLNVFEVTLLLGYSDKAKEQFGLFTCEQVYGGKEKKTRSPLSLCILNDQNLSEDTPKHFLYIKDLSNFKYRMSHHNNAKNRNTTRNLKCRFCDFFGSIASIHAHEVQAHRKLVNDSDQYELENEETRLRFTNQRYEMPAPVVVYADFESAIDDKNKYKPIMLSCLAVSRIPDIDMQLRVYAPHESEKDFHPFITYLLNLHGTVKRYLFEDFPLEDSNEIEKDFCFTTVCTFCHVKLDSGEMGGVYENTQGETPCTCGR